LQNQSFFYRVGNTGPEQLASAITSSPLVTTNDSKHLDVVYANTDYSLTLHYILTGNLSGSGKSGLQSSLTVNNLTGTALDFHLFQYSDFNLGGVTDPQTLGFIIGSGGYYNKIFQTMGSLAMTNTLTTRASAPSYIEAGVFDNTLASLQDPNATILNNVATATGNVTYAIQWDASLASGTALTVNQSFSLSVPEPSSLALALSGSVALALFRRRTGVC